MDWHSVLSHKERFTAFMSVQLEGTKLNGSMAANEFL